MEWGKAWKILMYLRPAYGKMYMEYAQWMNKSNITVIYNK